MWAICICHCDSLGDGEGQPRAHEAGAQSKKKKKSAEGKKPLGRRVTYGEECEIHIRSFCAQNGIGGQAFVTDLQRHPENHPCFTGKPSPTRQWVNEILRKAGRKDEGNSVIATRAGGEEGKFSRSSSF